MAERNKHRYPFQRPGQELFRPRLDKAAHIMNAGNTRANAATAGSFRSPNVDFSLKSRPLSDIHFEKISSLVYGICGINLTEGKKELVQGRLNKRLRSLGFDDYGEYLAYVDNDTSGTELSVMIDLLTTNLTQFFREQQHFDFMKDEILKNVEMSRPKNFLVWSAGCSSGEEPYSIAMLMRECLPNIDRMNALILATDISTRILDIARKGFYKKEKLGNVSSLMVSKYFELLSPGSDEKVFGVRPELSRLIRFRPLNLKAQWPMKGHFNVIFCRNVMIYFDKQHQEELVARFYDRLMPGGYLFIGHSESLSGITHSFRYVRPGIYVKPCGSDH